MPLLKVRDLRTSFFTDAGEVKAVNGVNFNLEHGRFWVSWVSPVPVRA